MSISRGVTEEKEGRRSTSTCQNLPEKAAAGTTAKKGGEGTKRSLELGRGEGGRWPRPWGEDAFCGSRKKVPTEEGKRRSVSRLAERKNGTDNKAHGSQ